MRIVQDVLNSHNPFLIIGTAIAYPFLIIGASRAAWWLRHRNGKRGNWEL